MGKGREERIEGEREEEGGREGKGKRRRGEGKDPHCFWTNRTLVLCPMWEQ